MLPSLAPPRPALPGLLALTRALAAVALLTACAAGSRETDGPGGGSDGHGAAGASGTTQGSGGAGATGGGPSGGGAAGGGGATGGGGAGTGGAECPEPFSVCDGDCVDTDTDEAHCGDCEIACEPGYVCADGACELSCQQGLVACEDSCIDPLTDPDHCGASGDCTGTNAGDACAPVTEECSNGICKSVCPPGQILCGTSCVDPLTDAAHCGASGDCAGPNAGIVCNTAPGPCAGSIGQVCSAGQCIPGCPSGGQTFTTSGAIVTFPLPSCVAQLTVTAYGAQGGSSSAGSAGGLGAKVTGTVCVAPGTTLSIVVGEQAPSAPYPCGGGGGSFVAKGTTALFVAGGGGGGYYNWTPGGSATLLAVSGQGAGGTASKDGGGGGGFTFNGAGTAGSGGLSFVNGAGYGVQYPANNTNGSRGGFGGGGGASQSSTFNAGGGGGFDGGNSGNGNASTGGASYLVAGATNTAFTPATRTGNGSVELAW